MQVDIELEMESFLDPINAEIFQKIMDLCFIVLILKLAKEVQELLLPLQQFVHKI